MDLSLNLITPVILCGGFGSLQMGEESAERPKPFRKLSGNLSRFQQTLLRVSDPGRFNPPMIVADQAHRSLIEFEMEMIGVERSALVLEPVGRGTAPSIALAALVAGAFNMGGSLLVMPCDHLVRDPGGLINAIHQGQIGTRSGAMLAFGRKVKAGDEEHAWIQRGRHLFDETCADVVDAEVYRLERFIPKSAPKDENALADGGDCYRNSGMYLLPIASVLEELRLHVPEVLTGCQQALVSGTSDGNTLMADEDHLAACPTISIERAVMEKTDRGALVPTSALWSEEGQRTSVPDARPAEESKADIKDPVILREAQNAHVQTTGPLTLVAGLDDVVVVNSGDAVVVAARDHVVDLLQAHEAGAEGDEIFALPQAALEMLRQAVRSAPDETEDEETGLQSLVEAATLAEIAHAAEEESLAREAEDTEPAEPEELEPELPLGLEPVRAEETEEAEKAEEEPPLLLHSSWESAA